MEGPCWDGSPTQARELIGTWGGYLPKTVPHKLREELWGVVSVGS